MTNETEKTTQAISIELDQTTYDLLHNYCIATGRTKKWVVTRAIGEYIEEVSPRDENVG